MSVFVEKPTILTLKINLVDNTASAFADWQAHFNAKVVEFPGLVSLEFLSPTDTQKEWLVVQRFVDEAHEKSWKESEQYRSLISDLEQIAKNKIQEVSEEESDIREGVTEVIVTKVSPNAEHVYKAWSARIHQEEAKFPGFRGVYTQAPMPGKGSHWITLLQFDTMENLDRWLTSSERDKIISDGSAFLSSLETHRVISPYAGWFASISKVGEVPSVWKQTMIVLLVLYPIVMLELRYLSPLTSGLDLSVGTFIGNALSVSLIAFPMMPIAIGLLGWWLVPKDNQNRNFVSIGGTCLVIFLYLLEILFFRFLI